MCFLEPRSVLPYKQPTFRQAENLANFLKVPLGYVFLNEPPRMNIIKSEFRTIGNKISEENIFQAKEYLGLDEFWYEEHGDKNSAFKYLRQKLESKGIIVMQSGVVGSNNHRRLNVSKFRGFL